MTKKEEDAAAELAAKEEKVCDPLSAKEELSATISRVRHNEDIQRRRRAEVRIDCFPQRFHEEE